METEGTKLILAFLRAMADESRLRIVGILANQECSVEELATLLQLKPPTVSHHLTTLRDLGLVRMRAAGNVHWYRLDADALKALSRDILSADRIMSLADDVDAEAWERKVLRDFFDGERLSEIPASRKKRQVVLKWLAGQFEINHRYSEAEVNEAIQRHHPDFATLRRELISSHLLERDADIYWRPAKEA